MSGLSPVFQCPADVAGQTPVKFQKSLEPSLSSAQLHMKEYLCIRGMFNVAESPGTVQVLNGRRLEDVYLCSSQKQLVFTKCVPSTAKSYVSLFPSRN
jgi:hypothetical protein